MTLVLVLSKLKKKLKGKKSGFNISYVWLKKNSRDIVLLKAAFKSKIPKHILSKTKNKFKIICTFDYTQENFKNYDDCLNQFSKVTSIFVKFIPCGMHLTSLTSQFTISLYKGFYSDFLGSKSADFLKKTKNKNSSFFILDVYKPKEDIDSDKKNTDCESNLDIDPLNDSFSFLHFNYNLLYNTYYSLNEVANADSLDNEGYIDTSNYYYDEACNKQYKIIEDFYSPGGEVDTGSYKVYTNFDNNQEDYFNKKEHLNHTLQIDSSSEKDFDFFDESLPQFYGSDGELEFILIESRNDKKYLTPSRAEPDEDNYGNTFFVDIGKNVFYVLKDGNLFFTENKSHKKFLDNDLNIFYKDSFGKKYYIDVDNKKYYVDIFGESHYVNNDGHIIWLDIFHTNFYEDYEKKKYCVNLAGEKFYVGDDLESHLKASVWTSDNDIIEDVDETKSTLVKELDCEDELTDYNNQSNNDDFENTNETYIISENSEKKEIILTDEFEIFLFDSLPLRVKKKITEYSDFNIVVERSTNDEKNYSDNEEDKDYSVDSLKPNNKKEEDLNSFILDTENKVKKKNKESTYLNINCEELFASIDQENNNDSKPTEKKVFFDLYQQSIIDFLYKIGIKLIEPKKEECIYFNEKPTDRDSVETFFYFVLLDNQSDYKPCLENYYSGKDEKYLEDINMYAHYFEHYFDYYSCLKFFKIIAYCY